MNIVRRLYPLVFITLCIAALINLVLPPDSSEAASQRTLAWSMVDTPADSFNGMIIRQAGINSFALGPDNRTFYAADTANNGFYKSTDAGYSWLSVATSLTSQGAFLPVWNVVIAPDDTSIVLVVTDGDGVPNGPKNLFFSSDGGGTWQNTGLTVNPGEYISCLDISKPYGSNNQTRDIAVGTRVSGGGGQLLTRQYNTTLTGGWVDQATFAPTGITSVKFSPSYATDQTIAVISIEASMFLHLGKHDSALNTTVWDVPGGYAAYPVNLNTGSATTIINSNLELPTDYVGTDLSLRSCFVNVFTSGTSSVFYISNTPTVFTITPPAAGPRISSISYSGTNATGILLAGEATANPAQARVNIWQSLNAQTSTPGAATWLKSDTIKSPTGGGNTGNAMTILAWSADRSRVYCSTSADSATVGGTGLPGDTSRWPFSKTTPALMDESAFSYSADNGFAWNQIGLINTKISQLSDAAAYEKAVDAVTGSNALYLASLNTESVANSFDSVWRSTSDPLGSTWERILTWRTSDQGAILRITPTSESSQVIVFADRLTNTITYSSDAGQTWAEVLADMTVKDIALLDDNNMYVLDDYSVRKVSGSGSTWTAGKKINTELNAPGHTLCTPSKSNSIVFVGTEGNSDTEVAWADFSALSPKFTALADLPVQGDVHVVADDRYDSNKNIYAGINMGTTINDGNIYRWTVGTSTNWDELDPINQSFYGLCMLNDILYGAWDTDITPPLSSTGVDRTLDARVKVPPPPEWDELIDGLPDSLAYPKFTHEPTSLHASSNSYNTLWAIDNQGYDFTLKHGCLWQYVDSVAKLGPWTTAPQPGGFIGADPATGRSQQIDFRWRPLKDIYGYDVLIAKDVNFTLLLSQALNLTPVDNLTGAWVVTPADEESPSAWISPGVLEVGRSYYWKVRGSRSVTGAKIHSPWSPTLFFSVKPGFRVTADYMGPTLLTPVDGICSNCKPPIRFSWSPVKNATTYEFILARNAQLTDVIVQEKTQTTAFELKSNLQTSTAYFWQVKAVAPVPSDPSPVGTFALAEDKTTPQKPPSTTTKPGGVPAPSDFWIWIIIVIVAVLLILINAYVFISRRRDGY